MLLALVSLGLLLLVAGVLMGLGLCRVAAAADRPSVQHHARQYPVPRMDRARMS